MEDEIRIRVYGGRNGFAASHFLVDMGKCERLHGHNYSVTVEVCGEPDSNGVVIDFNILNPVVKKVCQLLDHRVLIAKNNDKHELSIGESDVKVAFKNKRYVFPREDCVILPIDATTVEKLSCFVLGEILKEFKKDSYTSLKWVEVGISEGSAQMALCRRNL